MQSYTYAILVNDIYIYIYIHIYIYIYNVILLCICNMYNKIKLTVQLIERMNATRKLTMVMG